MIDKYHSTPKYSRAHKHHNTSVAPHNLKISQPGTKISSQRIDNNYQLHTVWNTHLYLIKQKQWNSPYLHAILLSSKFFHLFRSWLFMEAKYEHTWLMNKNYQHWMSIDKCNIIYMVQILTQNMIKHDYDTIINRHWWMHL